MPVKHIAEYYAQPAIIQVSDNISVIRFESMKIASVIGAIEHLEKTGVIAPGDTLVDSSSGIYAYALALVSHLKGYRCHIVCSVTVDATLKAQLRALGASLEQAPNQDSLALDQADRVKRVHSFLAAHPHAHWMQQYHDHVHYLGYSGIADEIADHNPTTAINLVAGVGSGASTAGLAHRWAETGKQHRVIGIQPYGSISFGSQKVDDPQIIIAGIGSAIYFDNIDYTIFDEIHWLGFDYAKVGARALLKETGIFAGLSSGSNYLVARYLAKVFPDQHFSLIAADTGHRYSERVYEGECALDDAVDDLQPTIITDLEQLAPPWNCMRWGGRSALNREYLELSTQGNEA